MASGSETNDDISTLFPVLFFFLPFFLASSGTIANVYLLKYTEDLDVVASDPISRGLVTPGAGHSPIGRVIPGKNKVRSGNCGVLVRGFFASVPLASVCPRESLNGQKTKRGK